MNQIDAPQTTDELDPLDDPQAEEAQALAPTPSALGHLQQLARGGNVLLTGIFLAGLAVVYAMSLRVGPATASAEQMLLDAQIDGALMALAATPAVAARPADDITNTFYYQASQRQIPISRLRGNPFVLVTPRPAQAVMIAPVDERPQVDPQVEELSEAMKLLDGLALQSVISGRAGATAMISNNLVTEGQQVRGWTIVEIRPREVVLSWRQHTYVLRMSQ